MIAWRSTKKAPRPPRDGERFGALRSHEVHKAQIHKHWSTEKYVRKLDNASRHQGTKAPRQLPPLCTLQLARG